MTWARPRMTASELAATRRSYGGNAAPEARQAISDPSSCRFVAAEGFWINTC